MYRQRFLQCVLVLACASVTAVTFSSFAQAAGPGYGWATAHFSAPGQTVVGTGMAGVIHKLHVETGKLVNNDQMLIKQYVKLNDGTSGPHIFLSSGIANYEYTDRSTGRTKLAPFYYVSLGGGNSFGSWGNPKPPLPTLGKGNLPWNASSDPEVSISLRMKYSSACILTRPPTVTPSPGNPACSYWTHAWEHVYSVSGWSGHQSIDFTLPPPGIAKYPVEVLVAHHGYYSFDVDYRNDVHMTVGNHQQYLLPTQCNDCGIPQGAWWPLAQIQAWPTFTTESQPSADYVRIYSSSAHPSIASASGICSGLSPNTPCGCMDCRAPAIQDPGNWRWEPRHGWPLAVDKGFGFDADWTAELGKALDEWGTSLGFEVFELSGSGPVITINILHSGWPGGSSEAGITYPTYLSPNQPYQCATDQTQPGEYVRWEHAQVDMNGESVSWTPSMLWDINYVPMRAMLSHELGHSLGLYEDSNGQFPQVMIPVFPNPIIPPPPAPPPTPMPFDNDYSPYVAVVNCLFYRDRSP